MKKLADIPYKWRALAISGVYIGGATIERATWPLLLPTVRDHFQVDTSEVVWLMVMFALGMAGSTLTVGHLGDQLGHKRIALAGLLAEGTLICVAAVMPVFWPMLILRLFQGMAAASALNNLQATAVGGFERSERGRAIGVMSGLPAIGLMTGPLYAGFVAQHVGWRYALIGAGAIILVEVLLVLVFIKDDSNKERSARDTLRGLDWTGSLALFASIMSLILFARFATSESLRIFAAPLLIVAMFGVRFVIRHERRAEHPILNLDLFSRRTFAVACSGMVLFSLIAGANTFLFPFYLQKGIGWSVSYAGSVLIAQNAVQPLGGPSSGWLTDRVGTRPVQFAGIAVVAVGLLFASTLGDAPPTWQVVIALLLIGGGGTLFNPANSKVIYNEVPQNALGTASAISASGRYVGQSFGAALAAALLAAQSTGIVDAFSGAALILAAILLGGMALIQGSSAVAQTRAKARAET